jgi:hypothetical protein
MENKRRGDPYKIFNFRTLFSAAALAGLAGAFAGRLMRAFKGDQSAAEETPAGARPIETVGTSTAGLVGKKPAQATRSAAGSSRARKPRKR